ncbi:6396_t:CDS:2, partial [Paraglomus occultum]
LNDLKPMAKGGFGSIYVATWIDGPRWTVKEGKLVRDGKTEVVIKVLDKLECGSVKFFEELKVCLQCSVSGSVLRCYGITRVPSFEKFAMVMAYCSDGDLHQTLRRSFSTITWAFCRKTLWQIAYGLEEVHKHNLVHGDFHSGNIFIVAEGAIIGDLGLCRLVDDVSSERQRGSSFGVLPYVAPENLRGKPYTHKSDVYSFGMIMWELTTASTLFEWHFEKKNHQEFNTAQALRLQMKRRNVEAELHSQAVYTSRLLDFPEVKAVRAKEETGDESDYKSRQLELAI